MAILRSWQHHQQSTSPVWTAACCVVLWKDLSEHLPCSPCAGGGDAGRTFPSCCLGAMRIASKIRGLPRWLSRVCYKYCLTCLRISPHPPSILFIKALLHIGSFLKILFQLDALWSKLSKFPTSESRPHSSRCS
jgi:hypothetical protein